MRIAKKERISTIFQFNDQRIQKRFAPEKLSGAKRSFFRFD